MRLLHVLLCAPVAVLAMAAATPATHARAAADAQPAPFIVALDAGHGGTANNADPSQLFDSGAVGANGLLEKDLALDMVYRVRSLLEQRDVKVVLTRTTDVYIDISPRMQTAIDAGAQLFVSIHMNGFQDPSVRGSLVMYPNSDSQGFAQAMSDAMARALAPYGVQPRGLQYRPEMWQHATMPTCTLEPVFITNPDEAALMARQDVRDALAAGVIAGLETYTPQIEQRRAQIDAWRTAHGVAAPSLSTVPPSVAAAVGHPVAVDPGAARTSGAAAPSADASSGDDGGGLLGISWGRLLELAAVLALVGVLRRQLFRACAAGARSLVGAVSALSGEPGALRPPRGGPGSRAARGSRRGPLCSPAPIGAKRAPGARGEREARRQRLLERSRAGAVRSGTVGKRTVTSSVRLPGGAFDAGIEVVSAASAASGAREGTRAAAASGARGGTRAAAVSAPAAPVRAWAAGVAADSGPVGVPSWRQGRSGPPPLPPLGVPLASPDEPAHGTALRDPGASWDAPDALAARWLPAGAYGRHAAADPAATIGALPDREPDRLGADPAWLRPSGEGSSGRHTAGLARARRARTAAGRGTRDR